MHPQTPKRGDQRQVDKKKIKQRLATSSGDGRKKDARGERNTIIDGN